MIYYVLWSSGDECGAKKFENLEDVKEELKFDEPFVYIYDVIEGNSIIDKIESEIKERGE